MFELESSSLGELQVPPNNLVCYYHLTTTTDLASVTKRIASYGSAGSFQIFKTLDIHGKEISKFVSTPVPYKLPTSSTEPKQRQGIAAIAYPLELFDIENGGISNILTVAAGWGISLSEIRTVRILDIYFPEKMVDEFVKNGYGPKVSAEKLCKRLGKDLNKESFFFQVPVYPRAALSKAQWKTVVEDLIKGSPDIVTDGELLYNPANCLISERTAVWKECEKDISKPKLLKKFRRRREKDILYLVNVSGSPVVAKDNAEIALRNGADGIMLNVLTSGFPLLEYLRRELPETTIIFAYPSMHSLFTREGPIGMNYEVILKLLRLAGADITYVPAPYGSLDMTTDRVTHVEKIKRYLSILTKDFFEIEPSIPSIAGGITLGNLEVNVQLAGLPLHLVVGGGVYDHPTSVEKGNASTVRLFMRALRRIIVEKKSMWDDPIFQKLKRKYPDYYRATFVDPKRQDGEARAILRKYAAPSCKLDYEAM